MLLVGRQEGYRSIAISVLGHFSPYPLRSFLWGPNSQRTEVTKGRSGERPNWKRTKLDIGYTTVDRFEWTLHHCRAYSFGNLLSGDAVCNCIFYKLKHINYSRLLWIVLLNVTKIDRYNYDCALITTWYVPNNNIAQLPKDWSGYIRTEVDVQIGTKDQSG